MDGLTLSGALVVTTLLTLPPAVAYRRGWRWSRPTAFAAWAWATYAWTFAVGLTWAGAAAPAATLGGMIAAGTLTPLFVMLGRRAQTTPCGPSRRAGAALGHDPAAQGVARV